MFAILPTPAALLALILQCQMGGEWVGFVQREMQSPRERERERERPSENKQRMRIDFPFCAAQADSHFI